MTMHIDPLLPLDFVVEPQYTCNLKCKMCARKYYKFDKVETWSLDKMIDVIEKISFARSIQIGGNHEPLLYPYFLQTLKYIYMKGGRSPFTTNGTIVNEEIFKSLKSRENVFVSVDGGTSASYQDIRNKNLGEVLNNISQIRILRPDLGLGINHILFKDRILEARNLVDFAVSRRLAMIFIYPIIFSSLIDRKYSPFKKESKFIKEMLMLKDYCDMVGARYTMPSILMKERPCFIPMNSPVIGNTGDVYPCCYVYISRNKKDLTWYQYYKGKKWEVQQDQYIMGNIFENSFENIWKGNKYRNLRKKLNELNIHIRDNYRNIELTEEFFEECSENYDPNKEFDYCSVCLFRWGRMGNI